MSGVLTRDPRTGAERTTTLQETTAEELDQIVSQLAVGALHDRDVRAALLRDIARSIDAARAELRTTAAAETGLADARLDGEITRAAQQFNFFADVVEEGSLLEVMIDRAVPDASPQPLPELRRMLMPVGAVAIFGASNFPFAFSVLGGDTASALAAGCPVVIKAHPAHPLTSALSAQILADASRRVLGDARVVGMVTGFDAGRRLVEHDGIAAVTLTGSQSAALAIQEIINGRARPIPFFAELGSVNPVILYPGACRARGIEFADGLAQSVIASGGQLCTKPGFIFIPRGDDGDAVVDRLEEHFAASGESVLLAENIRDAFTSGVQRYEQRGAGVIAQGAPVGGQGFAVSPTLLGVDIDALSADMVDECFGPAAVVVRYGHVDGVLDALATFPSSLTVSVWHHDSDRDALRSALPCLAGTAGRVIANGFPTGVRVSWAQHHGGPWPSTNSQHTSVGATAVRRFQRPVVFHNVPDELLPTELRDDASGFPRRVDGVLDCKR